VFLGSHGDGSISKDRSHEDCVNLSKDAFDPDAVLHDDIVDDQVSPYLSLSVDGLTTPSEGKKGQLELRPDDAAANEEIEPDKHISATKLDPEQLEVYGREFSLWRKLLAYIGF